MHTCIYTPKHNLESPIHVQACFLEGGWKPAIYRNKNATNDIAHLMWLEKRKYGCNEHVLFALGCMFLGIYSITCECNA